MIPESGKATALDFALLAVRGSRLAAVSPAEFATGLVRGEHLRACESLRHRLRAREQADSVKGLIRRGSWQ
jgi:hypothetical protein